MRPFFSLLLQGYLVASLAIGLDNAQCAHAAPASADGNVIEVQIGDEVYQVAKADVERAVIELAAIGDNLVATDGIRVIAFNPLTRVGELVDSSGPVRFQIGDGQVSALGKRRVVIEDSTGRLSESLSNRGGFSTKDGGATIAIIIVVGLICIFGGCEVSVEVAGQKGSIKSPGPHKGATASASQQGSTVNVTP